MANIFVLYDSTTRPDTLGKGGRAWFDEAANGIQSWYSQSPWTGGACRTSPGCRAAISGSFRGDVAMFTAAIFALEVAIDAFVDWLVEDEIAAYAAKGIGEIEHFLSRVACDIFC